MEFIKILIEVEENYDILCFNPFLGALSLHYIISYFPGISIFVQLKKNVLFHTLNRIKSNLNFTSNDDKFKSNSYNFNLTQNSITLLK